MHSVIASLLLSAVAVSAQSSSIDFGALTLTGPPASSSSIDFGKLTLTGPPASSSTIDFGKLTLTGPPSSSSTGYACNPAHSYGNGKCCGVSSGVPYLYDCSTPTSSSSSVSGGITNPVTYTPPASTSYTTTVITISSCAPTVTNCPYGQVVTTTVPCPTSTPMPAPPPVSTSVSSYTGYACNPARYTYANNQCCLVSSGTPYLTSCPGSTTQNNPFASSSITPAPVPASSTPVPPFPVPASNSTLFTSGMGGPTTTGPSPSYYSNAAVGNVADVIKGGLMVAGAAVFML